MSEDHNQGPPPSTEPTQESVEQSWKDLIRVHQSVKKMLLEFEEFDGKTFLQPIKEQRDALEHVMRARAAEIRLVPQPLAYVRDNLSKALGHEYRALFDIADHYSITIRERIVEMVQPYSPQAIASVAPEYYGVVRPRLEEIDRRIAEIREGKDVAAPGEDLEVVDHYTKVISELRDYYKLLERRIPALEEYVQSIVIGDKIKAMMEPYSAQAISAVAPDYYKEVLPLISEVEGKISDTRRGMDQPSQAKNVSQGGDIIRALADLRQKYNWLSNRVPALEEYAKKEKGRTRQEARNSLLIKVVATLIATAILAGAGLIYKYLADASRPIEDPPVVESK
jgi:hypothetical protein